MGRLQGTAVRVSAKECIMDKVKEVKNESPFKAGECSCGTSDCPGHEIVNGKITFKGHPTIADGEVELIRTPPASAGA